MSKYYFFTILKKGKQIISSHQVIKNILEVYVITPLTNAVRASNDQLVKLIPVFEEFYKVFWFMVIRPRNSSNPLKLHMKN